jgi:type II secretion system protein N
MSKSTSSTTSPFYAIYVVYGVLLVGVLLYYMFPSDAVTDYLQASVERVNPSLHLSVGKVRPSYTLGLSFMSPRLSHDARPGMDLFSAKSVLVRPEPWSFLQGKKKYRLEGHGYDGEIKGSIHFEKKLIGGPFTTAITLKDIRIDDIGSLSALIGRSVKGSLNGSINYSGEQNLLIAGTGGADLKISDGQIELLQPILTLDSIQFDELSVRMTLRNRQIDLSHGELKGREIQGTLSGTVGLNKDILQSSLNIRGTLEPFAGLFKGDKGTADTVKYFAQRLKMGKASFIIRGTLANPKITFI